MNLENKIELYPRYPQPAQGITGETEFEEVTRGMQVNRVLSAYVLGAAIGLTGIQNGVIYPEQAHAAQHGDVASEPDGRLNSVIGFQKIKLPGQYSLRVDKAMIDHYNATCEFAIDPWENWQLIKGLGATYPENNTYVNLDRSGPARLHKDKHLKKANGISIWVPKCGDPNDPNRASELPDWEAQVGIGVKNLKNEADTLRQRTMCTGFPKAWWEYRVKRLNPELREKFTGITITIPFPDLTPASIGLQIRFGSKRTLTFPVCATEDRSKGFKKLPTIPANRIVAVPLTPQNTDVAPRG